MNVFDNIQATEHAVCESSLMKATLAGPIYSLECHKDMDNGTICTFGEYVGNQVFKSEDFKAGKVPVLMLTSPLGYNTSQKYYTDEKYFYNAKGEIGRGYTIYRGDIWTVSESKFNGTPEKDKYIDATYKVVDQAPTSGFVARIIDKVIYKNSVSYRVFVESTGV
ncbi:MAG TPA: hypothetical protein DCW90_11875 [Lachnospiraceae bacterium]|nr:hypothetical protein [Lachnospiraceae bacterium]